MARTGPGSSTVRDVLRRRRASAYSAGPGLDDAMETCRRLARLGLASIVGYSARPGEEPRSVADVHLSAFDRLAAEGIDGHVSVKLSGIGFDPALLAELANAAERSGRRLHIDALQPETADETLKLVERLPRTGRLGTTLPGRWQRSVDDARRAVEAGLAVRVVKGHWDDRVGGSIDSSAGFLAVIDALAGSSADVGVATHDDRLLRESLERLRASGTRCEAQLLLGLPFRGPATIAQGLGVPIRLYVPYGDAWPGYGIRDLIRHPRTAWWLAQDLILGPDKTWRSIRRAGRGR